MTADLFHITRARDVDRIFRQGLRREAETPARKQAEEIAAGEDVQPEMRRESPTEQAEWWFDEVVADAKAAVDEAAKFPAHQPANFFWPTENQASQSRKSVPWPAVIVGVNRAAMPPSCKCAIGPTDGLDVIFKDYYDTARDHGTFDDQEQFQRAKDWWREVEWYEGQNLRNHEIWCGCDIPSYAIEWIYDPRREKRIYEPPEKGQQRLIDFEQ